MRFSLDSAPDRHYVSVSFFGESYIIVAATEASMSTEKKRSGAPAEPSILFEISQILDSSLDLRTVVEPVLEVITRSLEMKFATLTLLKDGSEIEVDSRPSDALALAVRTDAPIFASEELITENAIEFEREVEDTEQIIESFRDFLDSVTPEDFVHASPGVVEDEELLEDEELGDELDEDEELGEDEGLGEDEDIDDDEPDVHTPGVN